MNDIEARVATLLNERVDAQLGPRRSAPPFDPARRSGTDRRRRLLPLAAAAAVAAVAAGVAAIATVGGDGSPHHTRPVSRPDGVRIAGASFVLPTGWTARRMSSSSVDPTAPAGWCLGPRSGTGGCPVALWRLAGPGSELDVDIEGGRTGNPNPCDSEQPARGVDEQYGQRSFGGRAAEWRRWVYTCTADRIVRIEQYVVPTAPAYVLYSARADAAVHAALAFLVAHAELPGADAPLRLMDRGIVRAVDRQVDGVHVRLERSVFLDGKARFVDGDGASYDYLVPTRVFDAGQFNGAIEVGRQVYLATDGRRVTQIYRD